MIGVAYEEHQEWTGQSMSALLRIGMTEAVATVEASVGVPPTTLGRHEHSLVILFIEKVET